MWREPPGRSSNPKAPDPRDPTGRKLENKYPTSLFSFPLGHLWGSLGIKTIAKLEGKGIL